MQSFHSQRNCKEGSTGCGLGDETAGLPSTDLLLTGRPRGFTGSLLLVRFLTAGLPAVTVAADATATVAAAETAGAGWATAEAGTGVMVT